MKTGPERDVVEGQVPFHFAPGGFLLVLSGPSGAGKGTLVDALVEQRPECVFSISATTRAKRPSSTNSVRSWISAADTSRPARVSIGKVSVASVT